MANLRRYGAVARQLGALWASGPVGALADGDLLERFAAGPGDRAEVAFAALVERHGPMVLRVCRASLHDSHHAEDAFQATFLVLARRANSLRVAGSLAPWLHGVACRVSAGARTSARRRRAHESIAGAEIAARGAHPPPRDDLGPALHEEIERLPDRFRAVVVLCHLEGLTHDQAAERLACPVGTVRSRLARGRERLRRALVRRGLAPPTSTDPTRAPVVPSPLALAATRAAVLAASGPSPIGILSRWPVSLSEGVFKIMSLRSIQSAALLLVAAGGLALGLRATSGREPTPPDKPATAEAAPSARQEPAPKPTDDGRIAAMEGRLRELERKLEAIQGLKTAMRPVGVNALALRKIRPPVEDSLVGKVFVTPGQPVKKEDPLVEIRSPVLAQARTDFQTKFVQWDHDHKYLMAREPLAKEGRITQIIWTDTQNDEKKSRLDYLVSREKLTIYGMTIEQIDELLERFSDEPKAPMAMALAESEIEKRSTLTLRAPVDGRVAEIEAEPGNFYGTKDLLLIIQAAKP